MVEAAVAVVLVAKLVKVELEDAGVACIEHAEEMTVAGYFARS